jgi:hypothetical protein
VGIGVDTISCPIDLVGMDISRSRGYNFRSGIAKQNLTTVIPRYVDG